MNFFAVILSMPFYEDDRLNFFYDFVFISFELNAVVTL
jgi:hypothetical protein